MFIKISFKQFINTLIKFFFLYFKIIIGRKPRFYPLKLPFFSKQVFFDSSKKKFINVDINTWEDFVSLYQIFYCEDYNLKRLRRFKDLIKFFNQTIVNKKKPLILDCGGNIGLASRYFSETYKGSKVVCIEPDKDNLNLAKKNNLFNVVFIEAAIGNKNLMGKIVDTGLGNNAYRIATNLTDDKKDIEIITINNVLEEGFSKDTIPFIAKIDIEGFEKELFKDNLEWISRFPIIIIELHDWMMPKQANSKNFLKAISNHDRDFVFMGENVFSISNTLL